MSSFSLVSSDSSVAEIQFQKVKTVYNVVNNSNGRLGGGASGGPIYGQLNESSMDKVIDVMMNVCNLNSLSMVLDVGAGLGLPTFHIAQRVHLCLSMGVESEAIRYRMSIHSLKLLCTGPHRSVVNTDGVSFIHANILNAESYEPFNIIYMFDVGMPPSIYEHGSVCFNARYACKNYIF